MRKLRYAVMVLGTVMLVAGPALAAAVPDSETVTFKITGEGTMEGMEGMVCDDCTAKVKKALEGVEGVTKAEVDLAKATAVVTYDPDKCTVEAMQKAVLENASFKAIVIEPEEIDSVLAAAVKPGDTCCGNCRQVSS